MSDSPLQQRAATQESLVISNEHRKWAAEVLELSPEFSPEELRRKALHRLQHDEQFITDSDTDLAIRLLTASDRIVVQRRDEQILRRGHHNSQNAKFHAFCLEFPTLTPEQRRTRIAAWSDQAADNQAITSKLRQLEKVADVQLDADESVPQEVLELAKITLRWYAAWRQHRADIYQNDVEPLFTQRKQSQANAKLLITHFPRLRLAGGDWLKGLLNGSPPKVEITGRRPEWAKKVDKETAQTNGGSGWIGYLCVAVTVIAATSAFRSCISPDLRPRNERINRGGNQLERNLNHFRLVQQGPPSARDLNNYRNSVSFTMLRLGELSTQIVTLREKQKSEEENSELQVLEEKFAEMLAAMNSTRILMGEPVLNLSPEKIFEIRKGRDRPLSDGIESILSPTAPVTRPEHIDIESHYGK
ncbi:hypothetical protein SH668x_003423 [Planctomicrobium sp. SH668]|uniref:hypothetical protein n=1 Tax=Planctomicrobium sp. SH668 TaxID=3448126 RepID=UPI003F5CB85C